MKMRPTFLILLLSLVFGSLHALAAPAPTKEWNFLVFVNGVNNLDSYGSMNINQMEEVGSNDQMNILVQWGSYSNKDVKRLLIEKDNDSKTVTSPVKQNLGGVDMGDWNQLVDFVRWSHENFPAKHYFIVVWNHGNGWKFVDPVKPMDISYDDRTGNFITTEQLGRAMRQAQNIIGHKVDIYGSDACLMAMAEVAAEMASAVDFFVGSQDTEPGQGWPYSTFLADWQGRNLTRPQEIAQSISKTYLESYSTGGIYGRNAVTMAVYDLAFIQPYYNAFAKFGRELMNLSDAELKKMKSIAQSAKSFYGSEYVDAGDFADQLQLKFSLQTLPELRWAQKNLVIANDQNQDNHTNGISVWIPSYTSDLRGSEARYHDLIFNRQTDWLSFLKRMNP
jgi:hypothetical protein